jgi:hypothetical protein
MVELRVTPRDWPRIRPDFLDEQRLFVLQFNGVIFDHDRISRIGSPFSHASIASTVCR